MGANEDKKEPYKSLGKISRLKEEEITILDRRIIVWVREFGSGVQRCGCFFADKNPTFLRKNNARLRKRILELEKKLNKKEVKKK